MIHSQVRHKQENTQVRYKQVIVIFLLTVTKKNLLNTPLQYIHIIDLTLII